jgi:hypothetical protein
MGHPLDDAPWRTSSYSGSNGGNCVEVATLPGRSLAVRDSKNPDGPVLTFSRAEWRSFTAALKLGALDLR